MSQQHQEFKPRAIKHKTNNKKLIALFSILTISIVISVGVVSGKFLSIEKSENLPQQKIEIIEPETLGIVDVNNINEKQNSSEVKKLSVSEEVVEVNKNGTNTEKEKLLKDTNENRSVLEDTISTSNKKKQKPQVEEEKPVASNVPKTENESLVIEPVNFIHNPKIVVTHEVQRKETLFSITMKYFLSSKYQDKIAQFNQISNPETEIKVGMQLKIPDPLIRYHQIKSGETLFNITTKYYNSSHYQDKLAIYNGIKNPATDFKVGMELKIPAPSILDKINNEGYKVKINKSNNILTVYNNDVVVRSFSVATGKDPTRTPEGTFKIVNKVKEPWFNPENIRGGDPQNPLGSHWLGLNVPGTNGFIYGIHGTNNPASIGTFVSLGCIRMYNADIEWMYNTLPINTTVLIFSD